METQMGKQHDIGEGIKQKFHGETNCRVTSLRAVKFTGALGNGKSKNPGIFRTLQRGDHFIKRLLPKLLHFPFQPFIFSNQYGIYYLLTALNFLILMISFMTYMTVI